MTRFRRLVPACAAVALIAAPPASAQFGGIVFDPRNYAQNILTAARTLQQVNNQIQSLQNEARALTNQARNLASLPFSSLAALEAQVRQTQQLLSQAQRIAYDVRSIDQAFTSRYRSVPLGASDATLIASARDRWQDSVGAFEDALKVQAGVVGNIDGARGTMQGIVSAKRVIDESADKLVPDETAVSRALSAIEAKPRDLQRGGTCRQRVSAKVREHGIEQVRPICAQ